MSLNRGVLVSSSMVMQRKGLKLMYAVVSRSRVWPGSSFLGESLFNGFQRRSACCRALVEGLLHCNEPLTLAYPAITVEIIVCHSGLDKLRLLECPCKLARVKAPTGVEISLRDKEKVSRAGDRTPFSIRKGGGHRGALMLFANPLTSLKMRIASALHSQSPTTAGSFA